MDQMVDAGRPWVEELDEGDVLRLRAGGAWLIGDSPALFDRLQVIEISDRKPVEFNLGDITRLDTAGAWLIHRAANEWRERGHRVNYRGANSAQRFLLRQAQAYNDPVEVDPPDEGPISRIMADTGKGVVNLASSVSTAVGFIGLVLSTLSKVFVHPKRFRLTATIYQMEVVGLNALPIVGLVSFLIGVVIAYQGSYQLSLFGAQIFTVNLVVVSVLREFGILLSAIIIAGRSGSAFTAQIGSMKLHEEIDAMRTLSINPIETLVLPRFIALLVMMPILTFYSDLVGILGGLVISWIALDISPAVFIERAHDAIAGWDLAVGLIKAPIFGMIIALIGCYEGLSVQGSAESVGQRTTESVVKAIFTIIVLDAFFAIFFTEIGI